MKLWKVVALAFVAMCLQDLFSTAMVIYESRLNAPLAGTLDVLGWITGLVCAALAIEEIVKNGWRTRKSLAIISAVSLANFAGTYGAVYLVASLTHK